jgi:hypothetical protein
MLIVDTGPLVAMLNAKDRHHEACTALFRRFRGPIVVPAPIVTEVAYFLQIEPGPAVEAAFLDALARGELIVEATTAQDFARMADLVRQYADCPLGTADALVSISRFCRPRRAVCWHFPVTRSRGPRWATCEWRARQARARRCRR